MAGSLPALASWMRCSAEGSRTRARVCSGPDWRRCAANRARRDRSCPAAAPPPRRRRRRRGCGRRCVRACREVGVEERRREAHRRGALLRQAPLVRLRKRSVDDRRMAGGDRAARLVDDGGVDARSPRAWPRPGACRARPCRTAACARRPRRSNTAPGAAPTPAQARGRAAFCPCPRARRPRPAPAARRDETPRRFEIFARTVADRRLVLGVGLGQPRRRHLGADRRPHRQEERQRRECVEVFRPPGPRRGSG